MNNKIALFFLMLLPAFVVQSMNFDELLGRKPLYQLDGKPLILCGKQWTFNLEEKEIFIGKDSFFKHDSLGCLDSIIFAHYLFDAKTLLIFYRKYINHEKYSFHVHFIKKKQILSNLDLGGCTYKDSILKYICFNSIVQVDQNIKGLFVPINICHGPISKMFLFVVENGMIVCFSYNTGAAFHACIVGRTLIYNPLNNQLSEVIPNPINKPAVLDDERINILQNALNQHYYLSQGVGKK